MDSRTIRVTGRGNIKVAPNLTRLTISLMGTYKDYGETLKHSSDDTEELRNLVKELGFSGADLKTLYFHVDTEYESYQDENRNYKQRFVGYQYAHTMKLEFDSDNELLGRTLYALAHSALRPEFHLSYTVKDPDAAKNELLGKAVRDARAKADVLASAAGASIKELLTIDYSWGEVSFEVHPMNRMLSLEADLAAPMAAKASYDMNIEPDDIEVSDTVTVVWSIG